MIIVYCLLPVCVCVEREGVCVCVCVCVCVKLSPDPLRDVTALRCGRGTGKLLLLLLLSCEALLWLSVRREGRLQRFCLGRGGSLLQEKAMKGL